jgi:hypothetical protein
MMVIGVLLAVHAASIPSCLGDEVQCAGKYKGRQLTSAELGEILKQHAA